MKIRKNYIRTLILLSILLNAFFGNAFGVSQTTNNIAPAIATDGNIPAKSSQSVNPSLTQKLTAEQDNIEIISLGIIV